MSIFLIIKNRHSPLAVIYVCIFFNPLLCITALPFSTRYVSKWLSDFASLSDNQKLISTMLLFADFLWSQNETKHSIFFSYCCHLLYKHFSLYESCKLSFYNIFSIHCVKNNVIIYTHI